MRLSDVRADSDPVQRAFHDNRLLVEVRLIESDLVVQQDYVLAVEEFVYLLWALAVIMTLTFD